MHIDLVNISLGFVTSLPGLLVVGNESRARVS